MISCLFEHSVDGIVNEEEEPRLRNLELFNINLLDWLEEE